jgi:uncharacterized protein YecT (DUF1311 family)
VRVARALARQARSVIWHTTYSYPGVNSRLRHTAVIATALLSFTACRGHSADSGGDVALARDLAEAQLAGSSASAGGRVASDSVDGASNSNASDPPAASAPVPAAVSVRTAVTRSASAASHKTPDRARKSRSSKPATGDPCTSSESDDQNACLSLSVHRSNTRLDSIYRLIVKAVRKQQRVPAGAADPPYATTLGQAEKTWASWRDAECQRVTHGQGGDQWAVPRARCLATLTDERAAELTQILQKARKH